jgi:hypothetical protein
VSLIERGLKGPTIRALVRLAEALKVRPSACQALSHRGQDGGAFGRHQAAREKAAGVISGRIAPRDASSQFRPGSLEPTQYPHPVQYIPKYILTLGRPVRCGDGEVTRARRVGHRRWVHSALPPRAPFPRRHRSRLPVDVRQALGGRLAGRSSRSGSCDNQVVVSTPTDIRQCPTARMANTSGRRGSRRPLPPAGRPREVRQGREQNYRPEDFVFPNQAADKPASPRAETRPARAVYNERRRRLAR